MAQYNGKFALLRLIIIVLLIVIATAVAIAGILIYKSTFNEANYSDWLFYAAIMYIVIAVIPLYDVLTSSNDVSLKFGEFAIKGKVDKQSRLNDVLSKKNYKFTILMIAVSIILFVISALADKIF